MLGDQNKPFAIGLPNLYNLKMNILSLKHWTPLICAGAIMLASCAAMSQRAANLSQPVPLKEHSVRAYQHEFSQLAFVPGGGQIATLGMDGESLPVYEPLKAA